MSCRVLKRGVEEFLLNNVADWARGRGLSRLLGEYIPTSKNALVRDHYSGLGFNLVSDDDTGLSRWELPLDEAWRPHQHFIREAVPHGSNSL